MDVVIDSLGRRVRTVFMGRKDMDVGEGAFDSVKWALEVHCGMPDNPEYRSAVLYGWHESSPVRIDFYAESDPRHDAKPAFTWNAPKDE